MKEMVTEDDWVLFRLEGEGTHEGEWRGIEPTGNEVSWQYHGSIRTEDEEMGEAHGTGIISWMLEQVGVDLLTETGD